MNPSKSFRRFEPYRVKLNPEKLDLSWSFSRWRTYLDCPRKFFYSYILKDLIRGTLEYDMLNELRRSKTLSMIHGTALNNAISKLFKDNIPPNSSTILREYERSMKCILNDTKVVELVNGVLNRRELYSKLRILRERAEQAIEFFLESIYKSLLDMKVIETGQIEKVRYGENEFFLAPDLLGYDKDGIWYVYDWKADATSESLREPYEKEMGSYRFQIRAYAALAIRAYFRRFPKPQGFVGRLVFLHSQQVDEQIFSSEILRGTVRELLRLADELRSRISNSEFPRTPDPKRCKYCQFYSICQTLEAV